jgi:hypothetical protein
MNYRQCELKGSYVLRFPLDNAFPLLCSADLFKSTIFRLNCIIALIFISIIHKSNSATRCIVLNSAGGSLNPEFKSHQSLHPKEIKDAAYINPTR